MRSLSAILFDLGNVLVAIHPDRFASTLGLTMNSQNEGVQSVIMNLTRRYERGECSTDDFFGGLNSVLDDRFSRPKLEEAMRSVIGAPIPGMQNLLQKLAPSYQFAVVSNTNEFHFRHCLYQFPFLHGIQQRFLSYEIGALKPDPAYYQLVQERMKIQGPELLFIDDLQENVVGAQKEGMLAHLFKTTEVLSHELRTLGVLV